MTNAVAIGYMIIAARRLKLKPETIKRLETAMRYAMDDTTEETAEKAYYNN